MTYVQYNGVLRVGVRAGAGGAGRGACAACAHSSRARRALWLNFETWVVRIDISCPRDRHGIVFSAKTLHVRVVYIGWYRLSQDGKNYYTGVCTIWRYQASTRPPLLTLLLQLSEIDIPGIV